MSKPLDSYSDIHTHRAASALDGSSIVSQEPGTKMLPGGHYSVGIHPWTSERPISCSMLRALVGEARNPRVKAIGEAGFDRLRGGDMESQARLFVFQARLAAELCKPLIIHCVRAWDLLLRYAAQLRPQPGMWIIHGFRGKPALARQLLDAGMSLSYGLRYNPESYEMTPPSRRYRETDAD